MIELYSVKTASNIFKMPSKTDGLKDGFKKYMNWVFPILNLKLD